MTTKYELIDTLISNINEMLIDLQIEVDEETSPYLKEMQDVESYDWEYCKETFDTIMKEFESSKETLENILEHLENL